MKDLPEILSLLAWQIRALGNHLELLWLKAQAQFVTKTDLQKLEHIMAKTNEELIQQSKEQLATIKKVAAETAQLIETVRVLTEAVANQSNPSQELTDAAQDVTDALKAHDEQVVDKAE